MKHTVYVRGIGIGGREGVVVQSMADCSTMDTAACVEQARRLWDAGCKIVRFTTPSPKEAANLANIRAGMDAAGLEDMAIVADVHFTPNVALMAAEVADKVRINPGNFGGTGETFIKLLEILRRRGAALRVGVNHGSLGAAIVEKYGDTPEGMVESAMEYLRVCVAEGFDQVVVSMKSSNVRVMVHAYRLLQRAMDAEGMSFPLHLGVTEAGDGMAGRVKSAVGIGTLLQEGLGDTIRVSLTELPENEIPVARELAGLFPRIEPEGGKSLEYSRRISRKVGNVGGGQLPLLWSEIEVKEGLNHTEWPCVLDERPLILKGNSDIIRTAATLGAAFVDGIADGLDLPDEELALAIMQAARVRMTTTEYIACPGCGRTLYDLRGTLAAIKARTGHLAGVKIGVMGCIVNGPGEMADADYGYVGEGPGRITLYKGRTVVRRSIPQAEAIDALLELIMDNCVLLNPKHDTNT